MKDKKYRMVEVSEITIEKIILAKNKEEAHKKFAVEVEKDWNKISDYAEWKISEVDIEEVKE